MEEYNSTYHTVKQQIWRFETLSTKVTAMKKIFKRGEEKFLLYDVLKTKDKDIYYSIDTCTKTF